MSADVFGSQTDKANLHRHIVHSSPYIPSLWPIWPQFSELESPGSGISIGEDGWPTCAYPSSLIYHSVLLLRGPEIK